MRLSHPTQFRPPFWLRNPHAQTIGQVKLPQVPLQVARRERLELADGDFVDIDVGPERDGPVILMLHGLEGGPHSTYVRGFLQVLAANGFQAVQMYFRSCSGEMNRLPRLYHAGGTDDVRAVLKWLAGEWPQRPLGLVGVSLGACVSLNLAREVAEGYPVAKKPAGIVAISPPFELEACARMIDGPDAKPYRAALLGQLIAKLKRKLADPPMAEALAAYDIERAQTAQRIYDFDDAFTAPLHGYASAAEYYSANSMRKRLNCIQIPTRIIHAIDDPLIDPRFLPTPQETGDQVTLEFSERGGHVGFLEFRRFKVRRWLERRLPVVLRELLEGELG